MISLKWFYGLLLGVAAFGLLPGCSTSSSSSLDLTGNVTDSATATVGGAVNDTASDSVSLFTALEETGSRSSTCPTIKSTAQGSGCSVSSSTATLTLGSTAPGCSYSGAIATWVGSTLVTWGGTGVTAGVCGSNFPALGGSAATGAFINRTYGGTLTSSPTARTNAAGTDTIVIDTSSPSSTTFVNANTTGATSGTGGWSYNITPTSSVLNGYTRTVASSTSQSITVAARIVDYAASTATGSAAYDHTISTIGATGTNTPLTITISGSTFTVNGSLTLQHNLAKYLATSTFSGTAITTGCCYPAAGTVTTTFTGGPNTGKSESFTFSSATCASATLGQVQFTNAAGTTTTKTLTHCF